MNADDNLPRRQGDLAAELARQDLDPLSVEQLKVRIAALEGEIARTRRRIDHAVKHRASADALFRQ